MEQPTPEVKDWSWTLRRRCPECGLAASGVPVQEIADRLTNAAAEWVQVLTSNPAVTSRPSPRVWSTLEYGAHVRDVVDLFDARLAMMLVQDNPVFASWDGDEVAIADDYAAQDPGRVALELDSVIRALVARIRSLADSQLDRRGLRSDGTEFTVTSFLQYLLHDVIHHLWDVTGLQNPLNSAS